MVLLKCLALENVLIVQIFLFNFLVSFHKMPQMAL